MQCMRMWDRDLLPMALACHKRIINCPGSAPLQDNSANSTIPEDNSTQGFKIES